MDITVQDFEELCKQIKEKRREYEEKKRIASEANAELEGLENKAVEYLNALDKDSYKSEYGTVSRSFRVSYKVPQGENREKFFAYLKEKGIFDSMITVNSQTLNGWAKKEVEAAKERGEMPEIPGLGDPSISPGIRWRSNE